MSASNDNELSPAAESSGEIDRRRLSHAWSRIIPEYLSMCVQHVDEKGPGISIFRFLSQKDMKDGDKSNCGYLFMSRESQSWENVWSDIPNAEAIMSAYNPQKHIIVSVHIPAVEGQDNTIGNVRIFERELNDDVAVEVEI